MASDELAANPNEKDEVPPEHVAEETDSDSPIPQEVLENMPPDIRRDMQKITGIFASGSMGNPIARKVTAEHIDKVLDHNEAENRREFQYRGAGRWFALAYVLISVVVFFLFAWMFGRSDPELFKLVLTYVATFGAGFAGGWGVKAARGGSDD